MKRFGLMTILLLTLTACPKDCGDSLPASLNEIGASGASPEDGGGASGDAEGSAGLDAGRDGGGKPGEEDAWIPDSGLKPPDGGGIKPDTGQSMACRTEIDCDQSQFCAPQACAGGYCVTVDRCESSELCLEEEESCVQCRNDGDCPDGYCEPLDYVCVACFQDSHCGNGLFCDGEEECDERSCQSGMPPCEKGQICDEINDQCADCLTDTDCQSTFCNPKQCADGNCKVLETPCKKKEICVENEERCVNCLKDSDCEEGYCHENVCVECTKNDHCQNGQFCDGREICAENKCQLADQASCNPGQFCDENNDACVGCLKDGDCKQVDFCQPQKCSNNQCKVYERDCGSQQQCSEKLQKCVDCLVDNDCDNGQFCDGPESCVSDGNCQNSANPCSANQVCDEANDRCVQCLADSDCATGHCNLAANQCVACLQNSHCDQSQYCSPQACQSNICQTVTRTCTNPTPYCDEQLDRCVKCLNDGHCDDGDVCTGTETCDANGVCEPGSPKVCSDDELFCNGTESCHSANGCVHSGDPCNGLRCSETLHCYECANDSDCADNPDGELCNQTSHECVECLVNDDCSDGNVCNGMELCGTDNTCIAGTTLNCPDDGLFCNGTESCHNLLGCIHSGDPCSGLHCSEALHCYECSENSDCAGNANGEYCDISDHMCKECLNNGHCDDGYACTGTETCSTDKTCLAGTPINCNHGSCQEPGSSCLCDFGWTGPTCLLPDGNINYLLCINSGGRCTQDRIYDLEIEYHHATSVFLEEIENCGVAGSFPDGDTWSIDDPNHYLDPNNTKKKIKYHTPDCEGMVKLQMTICNADGCEDPKPIYQRQIF